MGIFDTIIEFIEDLIYPKKKEDVSAEYEDKYHDINVYGGDNIVIYNH